MPGLTIDDDDSYSIASLALLESSHVSKYFACCQWSNEAWEEPFSKTFVSKRYFRQRKIITVSSIGVAMDSAMLCALADSNLSSQASRVLCRVVPHYFAFR